MLKDGSTRINILLFLILFVLLWLIKDFRFRPGTMVCFFLSGYGIFRFFVEFFREPDPHIGLIWGWLSVGQLLCSSMILIAIILWSLLPKKTSEHEPNS